MQRSRAARRAGRFCRKAWITARWRRLRARLRRLGHRAVLAGLTAAALLAAAPASAWQLEVLDVVELPSAWRTRELSGLAWLPTEGSLMAVSDRGRLWRLPVTWSGERGHERLHLNPIGPPVVLRNGWFGETPNAEALEWHPPGPGAPDGALLVADEGRHRVLAFDLAGRRLGHRPAPGPADQQARLRGRNAGVEALAWHAVHGLIAATQRPLDGTDASLHRLHADDGRQWALPAAGPRSAVKGASMLDASTLLVLERVPEGKALHAVLRPLAVGGCGGETACDAPALRVAHPTLQGRDNFEGLACAGDGLCLLVSDDGGKGRTLLLLVRLQR